MRIHRHRQRKPQLQVQQYRVNLAITAPEVRVIDENGQMLGILPTAKAVQAANERGLDLVEVFPTAEPPVCKVLDYGHFRYQKEKEARKQKAQSHEVEVKGIRLSLRIGEHDLEIRHQQAKKFLERGDKVKIEMVLRGREKGHRELAAEVVNKLVEKLRADYPLRIEQPISYMGGRMTMTLARG